MADKNKREGKLWPDVQGQLRAFGPELARGPTINFPTD